MQANNPSCPHLIGGHGDWIWPYGKFNNRPDEGLESWDVVAGGTAAAVYTFRLMTNTFQASPVTGN